MPYSYQDDSGHPVGGRGGVTTFGNEDDLAVPLLRRWAARSGNVTGRLLEAGGRGKVTSGSWGQSPSLFVRSLALVRECLVSPATLRPKVSSNVLGFPSRMSPGRPDRPLLALTF